jgi:hypothetical protein
MISTDHSQRDIHTMSNNPDGILRPFEGLSDDDWINDTILASHLKRSRQTVCRYLDGVPHTRIGKERFINVGVARNHFLNGGLRQASNAA